jgi:hypothetical protein
MYVRVNANLRSETVEQLLEKKKGMHLTSAQLLADEVKAKLELLAASVESQERVNRDTRDRYAKTKTILLQDLCYKINQQCYAIVQRHKNMDSASYVDDNSFRGLVAEILNMKMWAMEKWQLWLKDESNVMTVDSVKGVPLLECHRLWLGFLRKRIFQAARDSEERQRACLELLQNKGLVKDAAHGELNSAGEDLIVAAGAEGWSAEDIGALLGARADVSTADADGKTGVWNAASCGHASTLKALLSGGGNVNAITNDNETVKWKNCSALTVSAMNGHLDCVKELIANKADLLLCTKQVFEC